MDFEDLFYINLVGGVCGHASAVQGPEEGVGTPGAGRAGSCELCGTGTGTVSVCS